MGAAGSDRISERLRFKLANARRRRSCAVPVWWAETIHERLLRQGGFVRLACRQQPLGGATVQVTVFSDCRATVGPSFLACGLREPFTCGGGGEWLPQLVIVGRHAVPKRRLGRLRATVRRPSDRWVVDVLVHTIVVVRATAAAVIVRYRISHVHFHVHRCVRVRIVGIGLGGIHRGSDVGFVG